MTTPSQTVGQRVRLARTARGYGVNELDRLIGGAQGYVSRLEGSGREPRADSLRKLAQALGVRLEWLATGEGEMGAAASQAPAPALPAGAPSLSAPAPAPPAEAPSLSASAPAPPADAQLTPVPVAEVVYEHDDDPYPNRSRALALLGHNLDPRARAVLLSYRFRSGGGRDDDLPLELWLEEAKSLQRQVRRLDREFAAIEREGQAAAERGDEPTGWAPLPDGATPPARLHHARVRRRGQAPGERDAPATKAALISRVKRAPAGRGGR